MVDTPAPIYVPVLKWRGGEKMALKHVDASLRRSMRPLIELVNDEGEESTALSKDIKDNVGYQVTAYVDVHYRRDHFAKYALDNLATHGNEIDIIPVARLNSAPLIIQGIKQVSSTYKNGVAIRIIMEEVSDFGLLKLELDLMEGQLACPIDNTDLIIDFGHLSEIDEYETQLKELGANLKLDEWRNVIVTSGVFPETLSEFKPNDDNFLERDDSKLWNASRDILGIPVIYSDYTVRYPYHIIKLPISGSVSIRYTLSDKFQVFRGTKSDKPFKYLAHALNIKSLYGQLYPSDYSWGDEYIHSQSAQFETRLAESIDPETFDGFSPGSPTDWIAASISHHMALILKDGLR